MSGRHFYSVALLAALLFSCKKEWRSEKDELAYWNARVVDPAKNYLYRTKDQKGALRIYDSLLARTPGNSPLVRSMRYDLSANYYYFFTSDNRATARYIDSARSLFDTEDLKEQYARTFVSYSLFGGQIAYRLEQYQKANDYFFQAQKIADAHLDLCERAGFNYNIAMVLYRQQNFREAARYFDEAYRQQATCRPQTTAMVLQQQEIQSNIGLCLIHLSQYDSALLHFDRAWNIAERFRDSLGPITMDKIQGVILGNRARVALARGQWREAEALSKKSIALNGRPGYELAYAQTIQLQLAGIHARQRKHTAARSVLEDLRRGLDSLPDREVELGWRRLMSESYQHSGESGKALDMYRRYIALRDSVSERQQQLTAADVDRQLRDREQTFEITMLRKDNQMAHLYLWVTIVLSAMALLIGLLSYQLYRRNRKSLRESLALTEEIRRQKEAREEEARLRHKEITEAVIRAQESERSAIGLELHDNVNQILTTVKLHTELAMDGMGDPKALLRRASDYLQTCINEIRGLSKRLSAPTLGKISLEESVRDLLASVNLTNRVQIHLDIDGLEGQPLRQDLHLGIYRILQEQINNVIKHADATEVSVALMGDGDWIRLQIRDNGKGFDPGHKRTGIGLTNMRTRAENLNGSFELKSMPGRGCGVFVELPLSAN